MAMYAFTFAVVGKCLFPTDMLRYDQCYPSDTESAVAIGVSWDMSVKPDGGQWIVNLRALSSNKHWTPTVDRWKSFSWNVQNVARVS